MFFFSEKKFIWMKVIYFFDGTSFLEAKKVFFTTVIKKWQKYTIYQNPHSTNFQFETWQLFDKWKNEWMVVDPFRV